MGGARHDPACAGRPRPGLCVGVSSSRLFLGSVTALSEVREVCRAGDVLLEALWIVDLQAGSRISRAGVVEFAVVLELVDRLESRRQSVRIL